jgi:hypothetical protein
MVGKGTSHKHPELSTCSKPNVSMQADKYMNFIICIVAFKTDINPHTYHNKVPQRNVVTLSYMFKSDGHL